jgi:PAS domain-containing protein
MLSNHELEPSVEVIHLRRLLDILPSCLMRLAADGMVLAANDAALMLLGAKTRAQALGQNFTKWLPPDQHEAWRAFSAGVLGGAPASIECDMSAPSGDRHPTLFHGVSLAKHPDGTPSMAVVARVITAQRHAEAAVVELKEQLRERDVERTHARERLAEAGALRRELEQLRAGIEVLNVALAAAVAARRTAEVERARAPADTRQPETALEAVAASGEGKA